MFVNVKKNINDAHTTELPVHEARPNLNVLFITTNCPESDTSVYIEVGTKHMN